MKNISNDIEPASGLGTDGLAGGKKESILPNSDDGVICSSCGKQKKAEEFHKNASRRSGREHRCKTCVSYSKAAQYKGAKKSEMKRDRFRSVVVGKLTQHTIREFAQSLGSAIKEWCSDDDCA